MYCMYAHLHRLIIKGQFTQITKKNVLNYLCQCVVMQVVLIKSEIKINLYIYTYIYIYSMSLVIRLFVCLCDQNYN